MTRHRDQWNTMKSPELEPNTYLNLVYNESGITNCEEIMDQ